MQCPASCELYEGMIVTSHRSHHSSSSSDRADLIPSHASTPHLLHIAAKEMAQAGRFKHSIKDVSCAIRCCLELPSQAGNASKAL